MKREKNIGIIGHFGGNQNILDGQTIKTKILYDELCKKSEWKIKIVDTYNRTNAPIKLFLDSIKCLFEVDDVIVLLSKNGRKFYFPILYFFAKVFKKNIYHDVIGGNLDASVNENLSFKKYLNSFVINWVETENLKDKLEKCGINNCEVLPNFKRLNIVDVSYNEYEEPYRFCTFSRVMKEKGIEDAIKAVQKINDKNGREVCILDIYGRIDEHYKNDFEKIITHVGSSINYKGMVDYNKSSEKIKDYFALLFPTFWYGEGFPGTVVDALSAGIPVIATDWNCNKELIDHKKTGLLYPNEEMGNLEEAIEWLIVNRKNIYQMKLNCVKQAELYQPDGFIDHIIDTINGE